MKIKELEWEDCTPTVSSNVVSRAQALGYTFEIVENCGLEPYGVVIDGDMVLAGHDEKFLFSKTRDAQEWCREWLLSRIYEVAEETEA
jgi:hypothetical protein